MSAIDTIAATALALYALYALGLGIAWLLPAPDGSPWVFRIGVAPLYSVATASVVGWLFHRAGLPLHPAVLATTILVVWAGVLVRRREELAANASLQGLVVPLLLALMSMSSWLLSLRGFGLYLPNRDFKNHAYFVAQVASSRSADSSLILRHSAVSDPQEALFYPLGLHTLLGWALPNSAGSTVGVTAAAAILTAAISAPLGMIGLARMWNPTSGPHWQLAGLTAVCLPGVTRAFDIGSVGLIFAAATYASALAILWVWVRQPSWQVFFALALAAWGLFAAHVAEAVGLFLVALLCLPLVWRRSRYRVPWPLVAGLVGLLGIGLLLGRDSATRLANRASADWDIQPNTDGPLTGALYVVVQALGSMPMISLVWLGACAVGFWYGLTHGLSRFPLLVLAIPMALGALALWSGAPFALEMLTAPWYGSTSRVSYMAISPLVLAGSLTLTLALSRQWGSRVTRGLVGLTVIGTVIALSLNVVPSRRDHLAASLAGAGDSLQIARALKAEMQDGQTVLNLEPDGTANLYAFARVPVLDAFTVDAAAGAGGASALVTEDLLRLSDADVARALERDNVAYIAIGTTSRYWGSGPGYLWRAVLEQPEVSLNRMGTDMVVLRYSGSTQ